MKTFIFKLKHDNGSFKLSTVARDLETAKDMICKAENCPAGALTFVKEICI